MQIQLAAYLMIQLTNLLTGHCFWFQMHVFVFSVFCAVSCVLSSVALKEKAPNGGYRLEAQESQNEEAEQYVSTISSSVLCCVL